MCVCHACDCVCVMCVRVRVCVCGGGSRAAIRSRSSTRRGAAGDRAHRNPVLLLPPLLLLLLRLLLLLLLMTEGLPLELQHHTQQASGCGEGVQGTATALALTWPGTSWLMRYTTAASALPGYLAAAASASGVANPIPTCS